MNKIFRNTLILIAVFLVWTVPALAEVPAEWGTNPIVRPTANELSARDDLAMLNNPSLSATTGCLLGPDITAAGKQITGADGKKAWAGVIRAELNGYETPVFCIDLYHSISKGDCFNAQGPTSEVVTWLLNVYPPQLAGLSNDEAAARQAAIWYFADGFLVTSPASVVTRAMQIIASVPSPLSLPINPPVLTLTPTSSTVQKGETINYVVSASQDGQPATDLTIELDTDLGTLSAATVTTDANGEASFTLTHADKGTADVSARAYFALPIGTELWYSGTGRRQTLVLGAERSGYVYARATATWQGDGTITGHKFSDTNLNGVQDSGEVSIKDWKITLYRDDNGTWTKVSQKSTDADGNAIWTGRAPGRYKIVEETKSGWKAVTSVERIVTLEEGGTLVENFANVELSVITAFKYRDDDLDGVYDSGIEPLLDGWRITLWKQVDGTRWADMGSSYTSNGKVSFNNLEPGTYRVDETPQSGWMNVTALSQFVTIEAGGVNDVYFGNVPAECAVYGPTSVDPGGIATFQNRYGYASYNWQIVNAQGQAVGTVLEDSGSVLIWQAPDVIGDYFLTADAWTLAEAMLSCNLDIRVQPSVINVTLTGAEICVGDTTVLSALTDQDGMNVALSYSWSTGETTQSITVNEGSVYQVTVTNEDWGLVGTASATVVVHPLPTVTVEDSLIVTGGLADLIAHTNAASPSYLWSTGETTQRISVYEPGIYSVLVTDGVTGCQGEGEATVYPIGTPLLWVDADDAAFCEGSQGTLTAETTAPSPSYLWSTGETTQSIVITQAGEYEVTVTSSEVDWTGSANGTAITWPVPVADFSADDPQYVTQSVQFTNLSSVSDNASLSYLWSFGDGAISTEANPSHVYATPGTYQVTLTVVREEGCEDIQTRPVVIDDLPTIMVCGYVLNDYTNEGIAGSGVSFEVRIDGRWQGAGSVIVGDDGYYSFAYQGIIEAIRLTEQNAEGYTSTRVVPVPGGVAVDLDTMIHENVTPGTHCAYDFYDIPNVAQGDCGCPDDVVFHSSRDGNWEIYRLTPGSSDEPINLTQNDATDMAPAVSENNVVAYQSDRNGNWDIYMVGADGQATFQLTDDAADDTDPVWSAVCQEPRLAFQSNRTGNWEIYVMDVVPGSARRVTETEGDATDPFWSPDNETLVYQSNAGGVWNLWQVNVVTNVTEQLTDNTFNDTNPQFASDGETIAFFSDRHGNAEIYTVDLGGNETRITDTDADEANLAISPDSQWIAFQSNRSGDWEIYVTDMAGTQAWAVASDLSDDEAPTWDCDSTRIVFQSERDGDPELYIVGAFSGAAAERLTDSDGANVWPTWQPSEEDASLIGAPAIRQASQGIFFLN